MPLRIKIEISTMEDVESILGDLEFLVTDWIPKGMLTGLIAQPGVGKSIFTLDLCRSIILAQPWFTGEKGIKKPGKVLWCDTESGMALTLDRMKKFDIPRNGLILPFKDPLQPINLGKDEDIKRIAEIVRQYKPVAVVLDSLRGSHKGDENSSQVCTILQEMAAIAEKYKIPFLVIHHLRKPIFDEEMNAHSCRGSTAIIAMFRSMIGFDIPDPETKRVRMKVLKENLGIAPQPIGFDITPTGIIYGPAPVRPKRKERATKTDQAMEWLRERMEIGVWYSSAKIIAEAMEKGYSQTGTLQLAREQLKIIAPDNVRKMGKFFQWRLSK